MRICSKYPATAASRPGTAVRSCPPERRVAQYGVRMGGAVVVLMGNIEFQHGAVVLNGILVFAAHADEAGFLRAHWAAGGHPQHVFVCENWLFPFAENGLFDPNAQRPKPLFAARSF